MLTPTPKPNDLMRGNSKSMELIVKKLGRADYAGTLLAMQTQNRERASDSPDEIWLLEHPPVVTLGLAGKREHVLDAGEIPVIKVERGGQVTYHGPGQLIAYLLFDVKRLGIGVKELVRRIEQSLIDLLAQYGVDSYRKAGMPGVYVNLDGIDAKIAAIGLRVANHATYHGLSLNVNMDLKPFSRINPCGYAGLAVTQMHDLGVTDEIGAVGENLIVQLQRNLNLVSP
jgi:lipoyl(octanoyl) transferase